MQLKQKIGLAVSTLLSSTQAQATDWLYDMAFMSYYEQDAMQQDRVSIVEPVLSITKQNDSDDFLSFELVYDALTGATPNGAAASSQIQNFNGYLVLPGYTPLDTRFKDTRTSINLSWMQPFDRMSRYQAGISYSAETDYKSIGSNYSYIQDINNKLTTLTLGLGISYDAVNPHGGFHDSFTSIFSSTPQTITSASGGTRGEDGFFPGKIKTTVDMIVGLTHVLNRYSLLNFNYGISQSEGYQTDPYKIISVVDGAGLPIDYVWENRPETRFKQTLKATMVSAIGDDALHIDYRHYVDDWGVTADTYDIKYNMRVNEKFYIIPHFRYSQQTQADFFVAGLSQGQNSPQFASADYRLGNMTSTTIGGMMGYKINPKMTITFNADQISQSGYVDSSGIVGDQQLNNLFPDLTMWAFTFGVKGKW